jgi:pimeloyl-ACP methyl ester carboxylesterase
MKIDGPARLVVGVFAFLVTVRLNSAELSPPKLVVPYGENVAAGKTVVLNGIKLYYETYGQGPPMLLIHGNGQSIGAMGYQIDFFASHYHVIAADSRGHGKSEMGLGRLTYEQMAEDFNVLLDQLYLKSVDVLGWSDGGIIGLLLALHHPDKVGKLAIMGATLRPDGVYPWASRAGEEELKAVDDRIAQGDSSVALKVKRQRLDLLCLQPHIASDDLRKILSPTLVMAGDKDVIDDEHTLEIFHHLPNAHLCIFPGATHMIPWEDPQLFNRTVDKFLVQPYLRPDTRKLFGM